MSMIDLHMHTKYSLDGQYTPKELINLCKKAGLNTIAITDHNSIEGIEEGLYYSKKAGIKLIPGIEIDCLYNGINVHLLGYGIDYSSKVFRDLNRNNQLQESRVSRERVEKVNELGFDLHVDEILKKNENGIITPEEIAEILLDSDYAHDSELLAPYLPGGHRSDNPYVNFYWDYFSSGKPCYSKIDFPVIEEAVKMVINSGGFPVLAHPGITFGDNYIEIERLVFLGTKGMEVFSSYHSPDKCEYFYGLAKKFDLRVTAGSDFHGKNKPAVKLGGTNCFLNDDELELEMGYLFNT